MRSCTCCEEPVYPSDLVDRWGGVCSACERDIRVGLAELAADYPDAGTNRKSYGAAIRAQRAKRLLAEDEMNTWRVHHGLPAIAIREEIEERRQLRADWVDERRARAMSARRRSRLER